MKEKTIRYQIEIPVESVRLLAEASAELAMIWRGNAETMRNVVERAYLERMGKEAPEKVRERVSEIVGELVSIGWDKTQSSQIYQCNPLADVLTDMADVLLYQMRERKEASGKPVAPKHLNRDVELCRVIRITESREKRSKQLRLIIK